MSHPTMSREEFVQRGEDYYGRFLRDELEPEHKGKFLALDHWPTTWNRKGR